MVNWLKNNKKKLIAALVAALVALGLLNQKSKSLVTQLLDSFSDTATVTSDLSTDNNSNAADQDK